MFRGTPDAPVRQAMRDLVARSLDGISNDFGRLIWLASMRDYNTGQYQHDGLAANFSSEIAAAALEQCHIDVFRQLSRNSLRDLVAQLEMYVASTGAEPVEVIEAWQRLEPYRVAIPAEYEQLSVQMFFSNVRTALAILRSRHDCHPQDRQSALR